MCEDNKINFVLSNKKQSNNIPAEIKLSDKFKYLIKACETICVAECCGLDAFDFSPLNIAAHLSKYGLGIKNEDVVMIQKEIQEIKNKVKTLNKNEEGFICQILEMNQYFRENEMDELLNVVNEAISESIKLYNENTKLINENPILHKWEESGKKFG